MTACGGSTAPASTAPASTAPASTAPESAAPANDFDLDNLEPITMVFGTMSLGSQYYSQANAMNTVCIPYLPKGSQFDIQTTSAGGPAGFLLVGTGNADISIADLISASNGPITGIQGNPPMDNVRALVGGLENSCSFMVFTKDFVDKTGISTIEQIIEQKYPIKLVTKALGSIGEATAAAVLEGYGISYDDIESWGGSVTHTDTSNVIDMLKDNRAEFCIDQTNMTQANWMELTLTTDVVYAPYSKECLEFMYTKGYAPQTIPAGTYNGQVKEDYASTSAAAVIVVDESLDDEYAYLITKAMCENKDALVESFSGFAPFDPETAGTSAKVGCKLHPGAQRYYDEVGYSTK